MGKPSGPDRAANVHRRRKSLTSAGCPLCSTKRSSTLLVVLIVVLAVGAAGAGFLLGGPRSQSSSTSSSSTSTSSTSTASDFKIISDPLIVGFQGGLFQLEFQSVEGKQIAGVVATLQVNSTLQAAMCSGSSGTGLGFGNCLPGPGKSYVFTPGPAGGFPGNSTFAGYDSGTGPGGAVAGQSYPLKITVTYVDGTSSTETVPVLAVTG
jgi:hypothetical protein